ncbi:MAG: rhodanese-related sulfurtransferase [Candidatus Paceibacterota bacterium]
MPTITKDMRSRAEKKQATLADTRPRTTLSFYRYVKIADPDAFREKLYMAWTEMDCLGRIYVAHEGINAQMNVPKENWDKFDNFVQSLPELKGVPYKIAVEEGDAPSFYKLTIKVRKKIVADGLDDSSFDPSNTGEYLTASEMNAYLEDPEAVVIDMRNAYESEIGHFEGAITPDVDTFREELQMVPKMLTVHKNKKIALYCTGGIRCEKASAWLKHQGYTNVKHLKGGVIDYKHQVEREGLPNKFKGKNFVFDERLGETIGKKLFLTAIYVMKLKVTRTITAKIRSAHVLFLGCDDCIEKRGGYCSTWCQLTDKAPAGFKKKFARYYNKFLRPRQFKKARLRATS